MKPEYVIIIERLKQNDPTLTVLNLAQKELTPEESQAILEALKGNTTVTKLCYLGNDSSGETAKVLGEMLGINQTIKQLYLGTNHLGDLDLWYIITGMMRNTSINLLDLNSNLFKAARPIAHLLEHHTHLEEIELTNSQIDEAGFREMCSALQRNEHSSLTTFNVYFPPVLCMDDFDKLCRDNADKHRSSLGL